MLQNNLLRILFVEDVPSDVDLAVLALKKENIKFKFTTVSNRIDLLKELEEFNPDLVISDYMMPAFNGLQALKETKLHNPNIPFILYTGSVNEETAVECLKAGAQDYVIKEHISRLPFAVKEALEQVLIAKEKKASELLLIENEEKLQSIFSAAPVGIGLVVNRILIEVNDTFCRITGYNRSELIGTSLEIIFPSKDEYEHVGKENSRNFENGSGTSELRIKTREGELRDVIFNATLLDSFDRSRGYTFTLLDITERKKADDKLARTIKSMSTLIGNLQGIVYRCRNDKDWTMEFLSEGTVELTGYSCEELLLNNKISYNDLIYEDDRDAIRAEVLAAIDARSHFQYTYRILTKSGELRWVWEKGEGIFSEDGKLEFVEGFITDITERKRTENLIKESEEKYRSIFENVQDVYFETLLSGTILEVSPSITTLSKGEYGMSDLLGRKIFDFYADLKEREILLSMLQKQGTVTDFEVNLKNRDGSVMPCSISAKLILNKNGLPEKIIGSMRDVTDRKNSSDALRLAKEKAETSDRLKTEFLNNISHEVRTPLNGILGFAEIISRHDLTETEKSESLAMLFESSNRLLNTITNYMDISLISSGSLSVNKKDFRPASVLRKIYSDFETACVIRHLQLLLEIPDNSENLYINSDPEICKKIITHLLDNAVKFTEKGIIGFGFKIYGHNIEFFVKDTGIGIAHDSFANIFDKFVKEGSNHSKSSEGSGLGLAISRGMSDAIGGNIKFDSIPGVGSSFYLSVPLNLNEVMPKEIKSDVRLKMSTGSPILVAEDDETNFYYLNALLTRETSTRILHALNGREAIEIFKANRDIRLILMDIKMPEIDGFEATKQIKMIDNSVNIIAITAYAMSGDEERILEAGFDGYLSKPINKKNLLEKIAEFTKE